MTAQMLPAGLCEKSDCLEVKWRPPGGGTQYFGDLLIDRHIRNVEGEEKWK